MKMCILYGIIILYDAGQDILILYKEFMEEFLMKKHKIKKLVHYEDMSDIERAKRDLAKYEFLTQYFEKVAERKEKTSESEAWKFYQLSWKMEEKADEIKKKYLKLGAFDMSYVSFKNKKIFNVANVMEKIYNFFEENTEFSREYIIDKIDEKIFSVEIYKSFEDNPYGCAFFDSTFGELAIKESQIDKEEFELLLRHEFAHVFGDNIIKKYNISGYSIKPKDFIESDSKEISTVSNNKILNWFRSIFSRNKNTKRNEQFNEACVEMFAHKDQELEEKNLKDVWGLDINLYTNLSKGSLYIFNANLVRQMIIAKGITEGELYKGLFNYNQAEKVMNKFKRKTFNKISSGMDDIFEVLSELGSTKIGSEEEETVIKKCEEKISKVEITIIDEILMPRISKMKGKDRDDLLEKYYKHMIYRKDYFIEKTGYIPSKKEGYEKANQYKDELHIELDGMQFEQITETDKNMESKNENKISSEEENPEI